MDSSFETYSDVPVEDGSDSESVQASPVIGGDPNIQPPILPPGRPMRTAKFSAIEQISRADRLNMMIHDAGFDVESGPFYSPTTVARNSSGIDEESRDESDISSDPTFSPSIGRGRKRQPQPPDSADSTVTSKRGRFGGRGRGRGRAVPPSVTAESIADDDDTSLFTTVKAGKSPLKSIVDDWLNDYKKHKESALGALLQFFIHSSGCKGIISPDMQANMDHAQIIRRMTEEFDEESGDYPLITNNQQMKRFRQSYCDFIGSLVKQCQHSYIYDQYLMDSIITILTGLADSQVRAFRHTATLGAMKLMTALVGAALDLNTQLGNNERQLNVEKAKHTARKPNEKLEILIQKKQKLEENLEEIRTMCVYIFKSVFVHRYRDILPEIRGICVSELGLWMQIYPQMFLDDSYLKYIGWTLSDKVGEVRLKCLDALLPLNESEASSIRMELFMNKFKARILEMVLDNEFEVAVKAVKLISYLMRWQPRLFTDRDCEVIYELVYCSHRGLAVAAGDFLNLRLFEPNSNDVANLKTRRGKKRSVNTPLIRTLVMFHLESELHEHAAYLVDSLIDTNEMLKDWECMADLLLEEPGRDETALTDKEETALIEIMVATVKQAATGEPPIGRGHLKKYVSQKESKQVRDDREKLTEHFIVALPLLFEKYMADVGKVGNLLQIAMQLELEIYTTYRQEKHLDALLKMIEQIVEKIHDDEVLMRCSKVYEGLVNPELGSHARAEVAYSRLIDSIVVQFRNILKPWMDQNEEVDSDDRSHVEICLKKVEAFYQCHDLSHWDLWAQLFLILRQSGEDDRAVTEAMVVRALKCCYYAVLWDLKSLDKQNPDADQMKRIGQRVRSLIDFCHEHTITEETKSVMETAFLTVCDLLLLFSPQMVERSPALTPLKIDVDVGLVNALQSVVESNVFVELPQEGTDDHRQIEVLHRRRGMLAAFCKLVVYCVVPIRSAAVVFRHYQSFYNDYGDIIKSSMARCREINKISVARALDAALMDMFSEMREDCEAENLPVSRGGDRFNHIRELAKKFALSFGPDQVKNREAVLKLHQEGIMFAYQKDGGAPKSRKEPVWKNLGFLEILTEFSNKLTKPDKRTVLAYLDKQPAVKEAEKQPFLAYRNSLIAGDDTAVQQNVSGAGKRGRGRPPASPRVAAGIGPDVESPFGPAITSTLAKKPRLEGDLNEESNEEGDTFTGNIGGLKPLLAAGIFLNLMSISDGNQVGNAVPEQVKCPPCPPCDIISTCWGVMLATSGVTAIVVGVLVMAILIIAYLIWKSVKDSQTTELLQTRLSESNAELVRRGFQPH